MSETLRELVEGFIEGKDTPRQPAPPIKDSERDARLADSAKALEGMAAMVRDFYKWGVALGHHQWLEHAGLMTEHLRLLRQLHAEGHCIWENTPDATDYSVRYLGEKVNCMFGGIFERQPELFDVFVKAAKGEK